MNPMDNLNQQTRSIISASNVRVLQQTYLLLAANVLFSAFCAYIGVKLNIHVPFFLAFLVMMGVSVGINALRNSVGGIALLFAFTGFLGLYIAQTLSIFFHANMGDVVVKALIGSAIIFAALSAYVLYTGTNFNFLGGFLLVGGLVAFLAVLGAAIFNMSALAAAGSGAFLLISSGYILFDTSRIIHGEETNYIVATMSLFMNLFNLFISLLNLLAIFGGGNSRD